DGAATLDDQVGHPGVVDGGRVGDGEAQADHGVARRQVLAGEVAALDSERGGRGEVRVGRPTVVHGQGVPGAPAPDAQVARQVVKVVAGVPDHPNVLAASAVDDQLLEVAVPIGPVEDALVRQPGDAGAGDGGVVVALVGRV